MITLDERGRACPLPIIDTKAALERAAAGESIRVTVDNEIAVQNLQKLAGHKGASFSSRKLENGNFEVDVSPSGSGKPEPQAAPCRVQPAGNRRNVVVAVSSDRMGSPEEELGRILMKGFLFALTQQEELPAAMLFYNGGARLTCEGSGSLDDIRALESAGVQILTCGTCLKYQHLEEKLKIGSVTNLYEIAEKMMQADSVIRP